MFDPNLVHLYSHSQLVEFQKAFSNRVEALTALVIAGKPRMDGLEEVSAILDMIEAEIARRPAR